MSPRCGCQDVVSQFPLRFLHLLVNRPVVAKMWSPSCLPHVVSQVLSPSCFPRFYTCCLVFHLSPRCGFPVVSQMWFPRCCLTARWFWIVFQVFCTDVWSPCCLLDVSQMWSPSCSCLADVVPRCCFPVQLLFSCLWPISHMWSVSLSPRFGFPDIGSWSGSCFVVFHLFPRCGLPVVS